MWRVLSRGDGIEDRQARTSGRQPGFFPELIFNASFYQLRNFIEEFDPANLYVEHKGCLILMLMFFYLLGWWRIYTCWLNQPIWRTNTFEKYYQINLNQVWILWNHHLGLIPSDNEFTPENGWLEDTFNLFGSGEARNSGLPGLPGSDESQLSSVIISSCLARKMKGPIF